MFLLLLLLLILSFRRVLLLSGISGVLKIVPEAGSAASCKIATRATLETGRESTCCGTTLPRDRKIHPLWLIRSITFGSTVTEEDKLGSSSTMVTRAPRLVLLSSCLGIARRRRPMWARLHRGVYRKIMHPWLYRSLSLYKSNNRPCQSCYSLCVK